TGAAGGAFVFNQNGAPAGPSQFYNNTIIGPRAAVAICAYSYAPGTTITNNLFVTTDVDVYGRWFAAIICPGSDFSNVSIDNNLYFNLVSTTPGFCTGGDCLSLSQWQAQGHDLHSIIGDPRLANNSGIPTVITWDPTQHTGPQPAPSFAHVQTG